MKLGKQEPRIDRRTLRLADYRRTTLVTLPSRIRWDQLARPTWGMLGNDRVGDCVQAGAWHMIQMWEIMSGRGSHPPTDTDALSAYTLQTGYNGTEATDNGTVMLDSLNYWRKKGYYNSPIVVNMPPPHKITGYATIHGAEQLRRSVMEFGGAYLGLALPLSVQRQMNAPVWTCSTGTQAVAGSWGGHCVCAVGYDSTGVYVVTWGKVVKMTWSFFSRYTEESYAVLGGEWEQYGGDAYDVTQLRHDIAELAAAG